MTSTPILPPQQPLTDAQRALVTLKCACIHPPACGWEGVPTLMRHRNKPGTGAGQLGAYCPRCSHWIAWVPQSDKWLQLEVAQLWPDNAISYEPERFVAWIAEMALYAYNQSGALGFHDGAHRSTLERAMLVVTELAELSEAARHDTLAQPSEHIPDHSQAAEEWADVIIRVLDHCWDDGVTGTALGRAVAAKLRYNATRAYRHGGKTI